MPTKYVHIRGVKRAPTWYPKRQNVHISIAQHEAIDWVSQATILLANTPLLPINFDHSLISIHVSIDIMHAYPSIIHMKPTYHANPT